MEVASPREGRFGLFLNKGAIIFLRSVLRVSCPFGIIALDFLLPYVGRIADYGVQERNFDITVLSFAEAAAHPHNAARRVYRFGPAGGQLDAAGAPRFFTLG